ncbi:MAG TPA: hypothetical protein VKY19_09130 [Ktedonosporobacter sp.]|jgi:hypothetical protein|nr:hypothetical protein [Ktedonosporobacter sp.]
MKVVHFRSRYRFYRLLFVSLLACGSLFSSLALSSLPGHAASLAAHSGPKPKSNPVQPLDTVRSGNSAIILVHGMAGASSLDSNASAYDCKAYFSDLLDYLSKPHGIEGSWHNQDIRLIGFYNGDTNCTNGRETAHAANLHDPEYTRQCSNYYPENTNPSQDGTHDESIYHLSCLFAWYLYYNFGTRGWTSSIITHSMGGLLVRNTIYQVQKSKATWTMPSTLGIIQDVIDFGVPNNGEPVNVCHCTQGEDIRGGSFFMNEMTNSADNPQAGGTDWTLMSSVYDTIASPSFDYDGLNIPNAGHKIFYDVQHDTQGNAFGYGHDDYFHYRDNNGKLINDDNWIYTQSWCDWQTQGASTCNSIANFANCLDQCVGPMYDMWHALWYDSW